MKKELARFFGDKRMAFTTILLPGLMIFVMYNFMGSAIGSLYSVDEDFVPTVSVVNLPASVQALADSAEIQLTKIDAGKLDKKKMIFVWCFQKILMPK